MKRIQQGFTLIELMIVVAIVGILAAIALPAYQDYIVRATMSEALAAIGACKTSVAEYAATRPAYPANQTDPGCPTPDSEPPASVAAHAAGVGGGCRPLVILRVCAACGDELALSSTK